MPGGKSCPTLLGVSDVNFWSLRFDVVAASADRWSDALLEAGALSVDAVDASAGGLEEAAIFGEPSEAAPGFWRVTRLTALCAADADPAAIVADAARSVDAPMPRFESERVPERDWVRETQAQFAPLRITGALWIVPTWSEPPQPDAVNIRLDPGLAFGTGGHPTTRLCLRYLAQRVARADSVLDYGCGSGILAIAAAKLGAARVVGVDIDPRAIRASVDNARENRVVARFVHADVPMTERFTIVVANILANPLRLLAPALAARATPRGRIALSGVLAAQAGDVAAAYAPWFDMRVLAEEDGWTLVAGERRADVR